MLGVAQQLEVGLALGIEADAARRGEALEGRAGALLAEIARHRRDQLLDRHRRAPQPEARRHRREVGGHEQVGLQPLDRRRHAAERERHIGEDVEREAPDHAVHQRRQVEPEQRLRPQQRDAQRSVAQNVARRRCRHRRSSAAAAYRPRPGCRPSFRPWRRARWRAARTGRRRRPARAARSRRRTAARSRRAARRRPSGSRGRRAAGSRRSRRAAPSAAASRHVLRPVRASALLEHQRHDDVVRHHDGERDRFDDHHGGRRRQAADERRQREQVGVRQRAAAPARTCRCRPGPARR